MTVNERLFVAGLLDDFDACVRKKDVEGINAILKKIELDEGSIIAIINSLK